MQTHSKMPYLEPWEALSADRFQRSLLSKKILALKEECSQRCNRPHLVRCPGCYPRLLGLIRDRYISKSNSKDWFSGRREFLDELSNMLSAAAEGKADLATIESRIMTEKKIWALSAGHTSTAAAIKEPNFPSDAKREFEKQQAALSADPRNFEQILDRFVNAMDISEAYEKTFFTDADPVQSRKYTDQLHSDATMEQVSDSILEDYKKAQSNSRQVELQRLRGEQAKLQRAKAASVAQKAKKRAAAEKEHEDEEEIKLPPCASCGGPCNPEKVMACKICYLYYDLKVVDQPTVFCRTECFQKGHRQHVKATHLCAADSKCQHPSDSSEQAPNGDTIIGAASKKDGANTVFCRECVFEYRRPAVFCELACAKACFQAHRENVHVPARAPGDRDRDKAQLDYTNFTTYTTKNIGALVVTVGEAMKEFRENHADWKIDSPSVEVTDVPE